jgi:uncharacterized protein with HXXEE motif
VFAPVMPYVAPVIPRRLLWCIPVLLLVHNAEEALTMPYYLPIVRAEAPALLQPVVARMSYEIFAWGLGFATLIPFVVVACAATRPEAKPAQWAAALIQSVVALNVLSHLAAAVMLRGYTPGLATAVLLNLPFSVYFFGQVVRTGWLPRRALWGLIPGALFVHGPVLLGLLALCGLLVKMVRE